MWLVSLFELSMSKPRRNASRTRVSHCREHSRVPKKNAPLPADFLQDMGASEEGSEAGVFQVERSHFHV